MDEAVVGSTDVSTVARSPSGVHGGRVGLWLCRSEQVWCDAGWQAFCHSFLPKLVFDHLFRIIWKKLFASKCKNVNRSIEWRISIMELISFIINSSILSILYSGYNT